MYPKLRRSVDALRSISCWPSNRQALTDGWFSALIAAWMSPKSPDRLLEGFSIALVVFLDHSLFLVFLYHSQQNYYSRFSAKVKHFIRTPSIASGWCHPIQGPRRWWWCSRSRNRSKSLRASHPSTMVALKALTYHHPFPLSCGFLLLSLFRYLS